MLKGLLILGAGAAAVGVARFAKSAIAEERQRRLAVHDTHEAYRWEGEGGHVVGRDTAPSAGAMLSA